MSSDHSQEKPHNEQSQDGSGLKRRDLLLSGSSLLAALSITGFTTIENKGEDRRVFNAIPDRYANPATSNLTVVVAKGSNEIQPFRLERR